MCSISSQFISKRVLLTSINLQFVSFTYWIPFPVSKFSSIFLLLFLSVTWGGTNCKILFLLKLVNWNSLPICEWLDAFSLLISGQSVLWTFFFKKFHALFLLCSYLSFNNFKGEIPKELANLPQLRYLQLHENRLIGRIPPELGTLMNLRHL